MPGTTSIYGLPYLELMDAPDIASATRDLAESVETELQRIESAPVGMEATTEVSAQSISAATITAIRWQSPSENVGGFGKPSAFEWTVPTSGIYLIECAGEVNNGQTGRAFVQIVMNGRAHRLPFGGFSENAFSVTGVRRMSAGAVFKTEIYCTTATTMRPSTIVAYRIGA